MASETFLNELGHQTVVIVDRPLEHDRSWIRVQLRGEDVDRELFLTPAEMQALRRVSARADNEHRRHRNKHAVFATRGRPMVPAQPIGSSWHVWPRRRHSEKPTEFFGLVEQISPGPRVELFARVARPGWGGWGAEMPTLSTTATDGGTSEDGHV